MHMTLEIIVQQKGGSTTGIVVAMKGAGKRSVHEMGGCGGTTGNEEGE